MTVTRLQQRRGTTSEWSAGDPQGDPVVLASGELGLDKSTMLFKIGDGSTVWEDLSYQSLDALSVALPLSITANPSTKIKTISLAVNSAGGVQGYSVELKAIADIAATTGLLKKTSAGNWTLDTTAYLTAESTLNSAKLDGTISSDLLPTTLVANSVDAEAIDTAVTLFDASTTPTISIAGGLTTGTLNIANALTTGNLNLATTGTSATTIGIGHANSSVTIGGHIYASNAIDLPAGATKIGASTILQPVETAASITLPPATGTLATLAGSESLTNKKLGSLTTNGLVTTSNADGTLGVTLINSGVSSVLNSAPSGSGSIVLNSGPVVTYAQLIAPVEKISYSTTALSTSNTFSLETATVWFVDANMTSDLVANFRWNSGTTLASKVGASGNINAVVIVKNASTTYRISTVQIDGVSYTPRWQGITVPTTGTANSTEAYTFSMTYTGATWIVLASKAPFGV